MKYSFLAVALFCVVCVEAEFGRYFDDIRGLDELEDSTWGEFSLSLSMSMSMAYVAPVKSPSIRTLAPFDYPIGAPMASVLSTSPNDLSIVAPTLYSLAPSDLTKFHPATAPSVSPLTLLECSADGLVPARADFMTTLDLTFSYEAQIENSILDRGLVKELELAFLNTAVQEVLDCNNETTGFPQETQYKYLNGSTALMGSCTATIANTTCFLLETELVVDVKKAINPSRAANLAYGKIELGMVNDVYVKDTLKKLTFQQSRLIPTRPVDALDEVRRVKSNGWVLGTCLGVLGGVMVGLMGFAAKKHYDNNADLEKELPDGESSAATSLDHADESRTQVTGVPVIEQV